MFHQPDKTSAQIRESGHNRRISTGDEISKPNTTGTKKRRLNSPPVKEIENSSVADERLQRIESALECLNKKIDNLKVSESGQTTNKQQMNNIEQQIKNVRTAKSIKKIFEACPDIVQADNQLKCRLCSEDNKCIESGTFSYDFSNGIDFEHKHQPRVFLNLKSHIVRHLETLSHLKATNLEKQREKENQQVVFRNEQIGKRLGRAAYKSMKKGGSYTDYEEQVCVMEADKIDVGNLNHSRKFVADLEKDVYTVLLARTKEVLNMNLFASGRPTPLSVIADKVTPNRRTLEVVGVYGYIGGKFQSIVAGVPEVISEDGIGVTRTLKKGLTNLDITDKEIESRCVGGAFDGEYFNLKVPQHLLHSALVDDDIEEWFSFQWDLAHILELAEHDARKNHKTKNIQKAIDIIGGVSKIFSYGKSYRQAVEMCQFPERFVSDDESESGEEENLGRTENEMAVFKKKFKAPRHFSNTRFATYSSKVLKTFIDNYEIYYKHMNRRQIDELDNINNAPFLFTIGALDSIYEVIGAASNAVQKPDITPWEIKQLLDTYINTLGKMSLALNNNTFNKDLFPTLCNMYDELKLKGEFKSCAILDNKFNLQRTRLAQESDESNCHNYDDSLKTAITDVVKFVEILEQNARNRLEIENEKNPILETCQKLFDILVVKHYDSHQNVRDDLLKYVDLAIRSKNISKEVSIEDICKQYDLFLSRVKNIVEKFVYVPQNSTNGVKINFPERINQLDLYKKMYDDELLYKDIPEIMHLSLTAICRNHCEAIVEGMGSVLTSKNQQRGNLSNEALQRETIIRWQGPEPYSSSATKLIDNALDLHFKGRSNWNFTSKGSRFAISKVTDRKKNYAKKIEKISF